MKRSTRILAVVVVCAMALPHALPAAAQQPAFPTPPSGPVVDVGAAPIVVIGVARTSDVASASGGRVETLTQFDVERVERGDAPGTITVQTQGGRLPDGSGLVVDHQPAFRDGVRSRLFLRQVGEVYQVVGDAQGKQDDPSSVVRSVTSAAGPCGPGPYCTISGKGWPKALIPVHYRVNANNSDVTGEEQAVQAGFQTWESDPGSYIDFTYDGPTALADSVLDDTNAVYWRASLNNYVAVTRTYYNAADEIIQFDMEFNDSYVWALQTGPSAYDVQSIATHESGHALGLDHVNDTTQVMNPSSPTTRSLRVLGAGDIAGVRFLYPGPGPGETGGGGTGGTAGSPVFTSASSCGGTLRLPLIGSAPSVTATGAAGRTVTLTASGLPGYLALNVTAGNTATGSIGLSSLFSFPLFLIAALIGTPASVTFTATDDASPPASTTCAVTIRPTFF